MKVTYIKVGNVEVKVIDKSSHHDRAEKLKEPLTNYFKNIKEKKYEEEKHKN